MSHFTLLAVIFLLLIAITASATDPAFDLGEHLFALKNYDAAITEYKRFLFFNPDHPQVVEARFKIGLAYRVQGWRSEAVEAMAAAVQLATETELQAEMRTELAVTLIASGAYDLALVELIKVDMQSQSVRLRQRARFLRGVAYLYQFRWEQARSVFQAYLDEMPDAAEIAAKIDALFLEAFNRRQKSEKAARLLSTFLPGLGQTYAGDWKNGLNALLLNGGARLCYAQRCNRTGLRRCAAFILFSVSPLLCGEPVSRSGGSTGVQRPREPPAC